MADTQDHDLKDYGSCKMSAGDESPLGSHGGDADDNEFHIKFPEDELTVMVDDPMSYTIAWLKTWQVLFCWRKTVWDNDLLWALMAKLLLLSVIVTVASYNLIPDPELLDASKFARITHMLTMFVTLMLSFFLSSSVKRWVACVAGFHNLFNAIRNMAMQLHSLGAEKEDISDILRYGVLSAKFLICELSGLQLTGKTKEQKKRVMEAAMMRGGYCIRPNEMAIVENLHDRAGQMWTWVASLLGAMAVKGDIPPMQSPTYGRIMHLAQVGQQGLMEVRAEIIVQMPFVYVHTLAVLIHLTSIMLAVSLGLSLGVTIHGIRTYVHHYHYEVNPDPNVQIETLTSQIQSLIVALFKGILGPLLFQAFFDIGIEIQSPFSSSIGAIPINRLMRALERDLDESHDMAASVLWELPVFNKARQASKNAEEKAAAQRVQEKPYREPPASSASS